jgi:hypothetical protein
MGKKIKLSWWASTRPKGTPPCKACRGGGVVPGTRIICKSCRGWGY